MACQGCAHRASKLLKRLGFAAQRTGSNLRACWVFETPAIAVLVPYGTVRRHTTRASILAVVARILFGPSRAHESPTPTEVWHLADAPADLKGTYWVPGMMVQGLLLESRFEVRRAEWLRIVGPVDETVRVAETSLEPIHTNP